MTGVTQEDIAEMSEAELASLAAKAPRGFTPLFADGTFMFLSDRQIERMNASDRAKLTFIVRAQ